MAVITLSSNNPKFSYLLSKNPATQRSFNFPFMRRVSKGVLYGWFKKGDQDFRMWFKDSENESSFAFNGKGSEFEYLDVSRYASPRIILNAFRDMLGSAIKKQAEEDSPHYRYSASFTMEISDKRVRNSMINDFPNLEVVETHLGGNVFHYAVFTEGVTFFYLLNWMIVFAYMQTIQGEDSHGLSINSAVEKYVNAMVVIDAPFNCWRLFCQTAITSPGQYDKFKKYFANESWTIPLGNTQIQRHKILKGLLEGGTVLHDVGCGALFHTIRFSAFYQNIFAYDTDESLKEHNQRMLTNRRIENVAYSTEFDADFVAEGDDVIMVEVIEHMEKPEGIQLMKLALRSAAKRVVVTTPNADFNKYYGMAPGDFRHPDHKYELTQAEFEELCQALADQIGWKASFHHGGDICEGKATTLVALFEKETV